MTEAWNDPRRPWEMQRVALDRDGIPHNVGWMAAATDDELKRQQRDADDASEYAWYTRPGTDANAREAWWLDRIDNEIRRRADRADEKPARREPASGGAGRVRRALHWARERREITRGRRSRDDDQGR